MDEIINTHYHSWRMPTAVWCNSNARQKMQVGSTCNMVTTCLSPVFVQIGAIPNFKATNPTLRLPGKRNRWKPLTREANMTRPQDVHSYHLVMTPTLCPLMALPGLIFEGIELLSCLSSVFLCHALPHVLLVIFCEVFLKPRRGLYCPNSITYQVGRAERTKGRFHLAFIYQENHHLLRSIMVRHTLTTVSNHYKSTMSHTYLF